MRQLPRQPEYADAWSTSAGGRQRTVHRARHQGAGKKRRRRTHCKLPLLPLHFQQEESARSPVLFRRPPPHTAVSGAAAAEATAPVGSTRRSKRGLRAAELAAAGLEVADPAPAVTRKRAAATETGAASSLPRKLSRRLADRLISTADDSIGPSTTKWSSTELPFEAVPNSTTCTLMSELAVPVDTGRLGKDIHSFFGGRIDRDVVAVTITAALNKNPYPYGSRYPLPGTGKRVVCISSLVGTMIVWPISGLTY